MEEQTGQETGQETPQEEPEDAAEDDEDTSEDASGVAANIYLRGPTSLPHRPIPLQDRPIIRPSDEAKK
jgi:hypothetical protein